MRGSSSPTVRRALGAAAATFLAFAFAIGLSGCPAGAELENEERFPALAAAAGSTGTAGSGPGEVDCRQPLPDGMAVLGCDYTRALQGATTGACAFGGCHDTRYHSAELDLTANDLLISRILEVPARHLSITCDVGMPCNPAAPACDACRLCPDSAVLLSKGNFDESWIIRKMAAFDPANPAYMDIGCGDSMPLAPGHTRLNAAGKDCLTSLFRWIAENGRACSQPAGGAGGASDAGTAGTSGAGTAGTGGT